MSPANATHQTYSFVKCQTGNYLWGCKTRRVKMFARFIALLQLRRSTAFLLERADDHLLDDVGLSRDDLQALHMGLGLTDARQKLMRLRSTPTPRGLPVRSA